jgi:cell division protein FtsN
LAAKITSRDFKRARGSSLRFDLNRWREVGLGLALGLSLSLCVLVWQNYREKQAASAVAETPKPDAHAKGPKDTDEAARNYEFYERLQNIEVQVPERAQTTSNEPASAPANLERPGVYDVQAGAFRNQKDADRVQAQLHKLGIEAQVQKVQDDRGDLFRVRIGPLSDLAEINRLRARLRASEFESQAFRVAD